MQLHQNRHALGMNRLHDAAQARNVSVLPNTKLGFGKPPVFAYAGSLLNDESRSAPGYGLIVGHVSVAHHAGIVGPSIGHHGRNRYAVAGLKAAQLRFFKQQLHSLSPPKSILLNIPARAAFFNLQFSNPADAYPFRMNIRRGAP
ncbi:hypothetical protein SDC9_40428 [bioreactor metagenome]|uniref:Uncharacterized protein n=1 Tax=bioreactor metagenome TaxID=1076179 RepID=A0A644VSL4_9ZZZZ